MSGPCTDCGGPDYQTLVVRITELEADKETADLCIEHLSLNNERMEAENERLTNRLEAWKTAHRPPWCPESSECKPAWEREQTLKAELADERSFTEFCVVGRMYPTKRAREIWAEGGTP